MSKICSLADSKKSCSHFITLAECFRNVMEWLLNSGCLDNSLPFPSDSLSSCHRDQNQKLNCRYVYFWRTHHHQYFMPKEVTGGDDIFLSSIIFISVSEKKSRIFNFQLILNHFHFIQRNILNCCLQSIKIQRKGKKHEILCKTVCNVLIFKRNYKILNVDCLHKPTEISFIF